MIGDTVRFAAPSAAVLNYWALMNVTSVTC
jgi:hypothetical protein